MRTEVCDPAGNALEFIQSLVDFQTSWQTPSRQIFVWRGVGDFERHQLVPSALRLENWERMTRAADFIDPSYFASLSDNAKQIYLEFRLIERFLQVADRSGLTLPILPSHWSEVVNDYGGRKRQQQFEALMTSWPPVEFVPILALAQHYGLPTRLLDWTSDVLVATYFAVASAVKLRRQAAERPSERKNLAVWCTSVFEMSQVEWIPQASQEHSVKVQVYSPPKHQNPNLTAQSGLFSWLEGRGAMQLEIARTPFDVSVNKMLTAKRSDTKHRPGTFMVHRLGWEHADELMSRLYNLSITRSRLFPGYGGVVDTLDELAEINWRPGG